MKRLPIGLTIILPVFLAGTSLPAFAAAQGAGKAVTVCKNEARRVYGEAAQVHIKRIRGNKKLFKIKLRVTGVQDKAFTLNCQVDDKLTVTAFNASQTTQASKVVSRQ
jgi:hypothetical protein